MEKFEIKKVWRKIFEPKEVYFGIYLFGKPAWELNNFENQDLKKEYSQTLKKKGRELKERLEEIAEEFKKLIDNGWDASGGLYDIWFTKEISLEAAEKELKELGLEKYIEYLEEFQREETEEKE